MFEIEVHARQPSKTRDSTKCTLELIGNWLKTVFLELNWSKDNFVLWNYPKIWRYFQPNLYKATAGFLSYTTRHHMPLGRGEPNPELPAMDL
jgi:hypothetical protein